MALPSATAVLSSTYVFPSVSRRGEHPLKWIDVGGCSTDIGNHRPSVRLARRGQRRDLHDPVVVAPIQERTDVPNRYPGPS